MAPDSSLQDRAGLRRARVCESQPFTDNTAECPPGCYYKAATVRPRLGLAQEFSPAPPPRHARTCTLSRNSFPVWRGRLLALAELSFRQQIPTCDLDPSTDGMSMCPGGCAEFFQSNDMPAACTGDAFPLIPATCTGRAMENSGRVNFECYNLKTLPENRGGCAEPWCHKYEDGYGVRGQGWERDCHQMCTQTGGLKSGGASRAMAALWAGAIVLLLPAFLL